MKNFEQWLKETHPDPDSAMCIHNNTVFYRENEVKAYLARTEKENEELRELLKSSIAVGFGNPDISGSAYLDACEHEKKVNSYLNNQKEV